MSSPFLTGLANQLGDQFGLGENENRSLDIAADGTAQRYGKLGDFAKKIDQSQQRQYLQEGYLRTDLYNASPKQMEILFQEPDITVLVKKRAFCALADNYQLDHMSADEKLFYKATKILFANKCKQIAALERLSKIERISTTTGELSSALIPLIISLVDEAANSSVDFTNPVNSLTPNNLSSGTNSLSGGITKLQSITDKIKKIYSFSHSNFYTSWLIDSANIFKTQYAQGTGVIEFCNVTGVNTTTTTNTDGGRFDLAISDPYNLMLITSNDIERALNDATNQVYNNRVVQLGQENADSIVATNTKALNDLRARRGASPIQFLTSPNTIIGKRVAALITGAGEEINFTYNAAAGLSGIAPGLGGVMVAPESLRGGQNVQDDGIDSFAELSQFSNIIEDIFNSLQIQTNAQSIGQQNSSLTNYARRKLRLHYCGKLVIQPMDQIHIYTGSKSRLDNKVLGGLQNMFTGLGFLQKINNTASDFKNQFDSLFNPNSNVNFQLEKNVFVGPEFPNWLWTIMRSMFVNETSGVHTFGGVVINSESSYRNGSYTANLSGRDMTYYLEQGRVNFKPSVDVFNGPLYDPLTVFKTSFDTVSNNFQSNQFDLLDENKSLLSSKILKFKAGHYAGQTATEITHNNSDAENQNIGDVKKVFYSPDGFVKKWKEGIGTFTHLSNSFVVQGDSTIGTPATTIDPFAGQDVMNAISLSITGHPYNYTNFYKATSEFDSFGRDPQTGLDSALSYYKSLTRDLIKNNLLWGNFIPFKSLVLDEATYQKMINSQISILQNNDVINSQLKTTQELTSQLQFLLNGNQQDSQIKSLTDKVRSALQAQQLLLTNQLNNVNSQITNNQGNQGLNIIGNDVSFDPNEFLNSDSQHNNSLSQPGIRRELRRKINFLTRRLSWQVRSNEDKNLFIVDDSYDKDYDIQAFEKALGDMKLFDSEFSSVKEKIETAAKLLNLEVFCDTQGHIRCRPPQYNRMPSSVFYKLFKLKKQNGIQLFPQFLENLFVTQLEGLQNNLEIVEDQIRLDAALLGAATDRDVKNVINGFKGGPQSLLSLGSQSFEFITDQNTGNLSSFNKLNSEANPDEKINSIDNTIVGELESQAGITSSFNPIQRSQFILNTIVDPLLNEGTLQGLLTSMQNSQSRLGTIKSRLELKTGQQINLDNYKTNNYAVDVETATNNNSNTPRVPDTFKISNDIAVKITQRQNIVKQLFKAIKNAQESVSLDSTDGQSISNKLLMPNISQNSQIPEVFENMIEDETYDDLGPNSGKRYIIEDYQILSFSIAENPPPYTMVEVKGQLDLLVSNNSLPQDTGTFTPGGGNSLVNAAAVDYDLWRMYGFKNSSSFSAPFLSDPESQCAPYAATILSRARQEIFGGNITIIGNEYMQPGDVVYLRSRDLLFYVPSVSQSFSYGSPGSFQTTLELKYGHTAGEYIPTFLDVIGKLLYNNRDSTSYINRRQDNAFNQQPVGVITLNKSSSSSDDISKQLFSGPTGNQNSKVINDILYTTYNAILTNNNTNSVIKPNIELRLYYDTKNNQNAVDPTLLDAANFVRQVLIGQSDLPNTNTTGATNKILTIDDVLDPANSAVDISGNNEHRSPSQKAVDMIRNINNSVSAGDASNTQITSTLYSYIIDVWITFTNTSESI